MLSTNQKGAIAETAITAEATKLGIEVYGPVFGGGRFDLIFCFPDGELSRVQCKWAPREREVVTIRPYSTRRGASGFIQRTYSADEVDAIAAYCAELDRCYYVPIAEIAGRHTFHLRLTPARNNQLLGVHFEAEYRLGAVAQLGERLAGSQKVRGSSPLSSIV
jgi:hypothetical protein